ncbi:DNA excision repair protein ERCC-6-like [Leptopilina boulardi]|uniref:DNA excision repair protein ERCC-6-like n=1 Tax=Leptopilina boulardi TaxID=63433 RepID=UPI0021F62422|nr:DNA excision repair protein ERCC-6-like [Leptopilina boulardi]
MDDEIEESALKQVISIRLESSVLQEASEKISQIIKNNKSSNKDTKQLESEIKNEENFNQNELVRTGEITPFQAEEKINFQQSNGKSNETNQLTQFENYLKHQAELSKICKFLKKRKNTTPTLNEIKNKKSKITKSNNDNCEYENLNKNSKTIANNDNCEYQNENLNKIEDNHKETINEGENEIFEKVNSNRIFTRGKKITIEEKEEEEEEEEEEENIKNSDSGSEYLPSDEENSNNDYLIKRKVNIEKNKLKFNREIDDGDEEIYRERVRGTRRLKKEPMHNIDNLFKVPEKIWKNLYHYQRVSVQWLWELNNRNVGGLMGDEMGLGKTVQVIAFLAGLEASELLLDDGRFRGLGPTLIVCPATLLDQWVKHFHNWSPITRVALLHHSGSFQGKTSDLIESIKHGGILLTSYTGVLLNNDLLIKTDWHYVILDEGHKIRNPDAKVTKLVKQFSTPHRLLLTGSPMQNSLKELWSLFDFILPGKLGTLVAFIEHCANPITRGGYTNATQLQEATALQMATMLRNAITPYMLRRTKIDVQHHLNLPEKNEQVLFCSLSDEQKKFYREYLLSDDVSHVIHERNSRNGIYRARMLVALTALRKLCNHPDLFLFNHQIMDSEDDECMELTEEIMETFGHWKRAGKMIVVRSLLKIWKKQGHRVLLFTQSRQMMHILEALIQLEKYSYLRLDGMTPMGQRQQTIEKFNTESLYFVFLSTTRVGGLGVNLTGANRVIIYDPDWNPAIDSQARERAWRIGQDKNVTIYRLITAGTIEEKIYHRQVFKLLLSNKILEDPRQRRLFHTTDITELFNLNETFDGEAESNELFKHSKLDAPMKKQKKKRKKIKKNIMTNFSSTKLNAMRKLAAELSKEIGKKGKSNDEILKNREKSKNYFEKSEKIRKNSNNLKIEIFCQNQQIQNKFNEMENIDSKIENIDDNKNDEENENLENKIENKNENENKMEKLENSEKIKENIENKIENTENKIHGNECKMEVSENSVQRKENKIQLENFTQEKEKKMENSVERKENNIAESDGKKENSPKNEENKKVNDTIEREKNENLSNKKKKFEEKIALSSEEEGEIRETEETIKIVNEEKRKKRKKKKNKKLNNRKKQVSAIFEGEQVPCLIGRRLGYSKEYQEPIATDDDDYVLYKLFSKAVVSSAFQHDSVISRTSGEPIEKSLLERTAVETANEGMEKIRNSRRYYNKPSWKSNE